VDGTPSRVFQSRRIFLQKLPQTAEKCGKNATPTKHGFECLPRKGRDLLQAKVLSEELSGPVASEAAGGTLPRNSPCSSSWAITPGTGATGRSRASLWTSGPQHRSTIRSTAPPLPVLRPSPGGVSFAHEPARRARSQRKGCRTVSHVTLMPD